MLSSSPSKIHEPRVTGVSPRPTDQRQRQKTAKHEGGSSSLRSALRVARWSRSASGAVLSAQDGDLIT